MERAELLTVKYENENTESNSLNLRDLGESLIGLDKILTSGIWVTGIHNTPPRSRGRPEDRLFQIEGTELRTGCVEIATLLTVGTAFGSLFSDGYLSIATRLMGSWVKLAVQNAVLNKIGRNRAENTQVEGLVRNNEALTNTIVEMSKWQFEDRRDERRHVEAIQSKALDALIRPVEMFVSPTKDACDHILVPNGFESFTIDRNLVAPILNRKDFTYGRNREIWIKIDGLTKRTKQLKVIPRGFQNRLLTAYVDDPAIRGDVASNPYLHALNHELPVKVMGKYARDNNGDIKHMRISRLIEFG